MILFSLTTSLQRTLMVYVDSEGVVIHGPTGDVIGRMAPGPLEYLNKWGYGRRFSIGPNHLRSIDARIVIQANRWFGYDDVTLVIKADGSVFYDGEEVAFVSPSDIHHWRKYLGLKGSSFLMEGTTNGGELSLDPFTLVESH